MSCSSICEKGTKIIDAYYTTSGMLDKSISLLDIARCRMYHFSREGAFMAKLEGK